MRPRLLAALMTLTLAAGCAGPTPGPRAAPPRSLKNLEVMPSVIVHEPEPAIELQAAVDAYQALADAAEPGSALRMASMRRAADLELELAEERMSAPAGKAGPAKLSADSAYSAAIARYQALLAAFPAYAQADEVYYQLAKAHDAIGRTDGALAALDRLVKENPGSPYAGEAQFRRGELLFILRDYDRAAAAYRAALAQGELTVYHEQALYKLGWSLLQQARYDRAVEIFMQILEGKLVPRIPTLAALAPDELPPAERELVDDVLRAIGFCLVSSGTGVPDRAGGQARPYTHLLYRAVAERYLEQARYREAVATYRSFIERYPQSAEAPRFQIAIYQLYDKVGMTDQAWAAREAFVERYRADAAFWRTHALRDFPDVAERLKADLMDLARHAHARAQETGQAQYAATASRRYSDFLAFFPNDPRAAQTRFLLAELLFEQGDFAAAVQQYERFAYDNPNDERAGAAAYAALTAYQRLIATASGVERDSLRYQLIDSGLRFAARFPHHPEAVAVLAKSADELFALKQYSRARAVAGRVLQHVPPAPDPERRAAAAIVGHIAFDAKDYAAAERAYRIALTASPPGAAQRPALAERLAAAIYEQGAAERAAGHPGLAAAQFLRVAELAPGTQIAGTAEYDAAALLLGLKRWERAIEVLEHFGNAYPQHELQAEARRKLAAAYLETGRLGSAAQEFGRVGTDSPDPTLKREALWRAAELYQKADQNDAAATAYKRYLSAFPQPLSQAMEARTRLARLAAQRGDTPEQRYWLNEIIAADRAGGDDASHALAADAALTLADPLRADYEQIRLVIPLEASLARKKQALEQALEAYGRAADYGIAAVTTAATFRIGELYHDFSRALLDSQRPDGLSAEELEQYDLLLEEQAYPFEEQAIALHETNWRRLRDGIYDQWVKASLEQLAALVPARYGKQERVVQYVDAIR